MGVSAVNPYLGLSRVRGRQAELPALAGQRRTSSPRRRRAVRALSHRLGIVLVRLGWRLITTESLPDRGLHALPRAGT